MNKFDRITAMAWRLYCHTEGGRRPMEACYEEAEEFLALGDKRFAPERERIQAERVKVIDADHGTSMVLPR